MSAINSHCYKPSGFWCCICVFQVWFCRQNEKFSLSTVYKLTSIHFLERYRMSHPVYYLIVPLLVRRQVIWDGQALIPLFHSLLEEMSWCYRKNFLSRSDWSFCPWSFECPADVTCEQCCLCAQGTTSRHSEVRQIVAKETIIAFQTYKWQSAWWTHVESAVSSRCERLLRFCERPSLQ